MSTLANQVHDMEQRFKKLTLDHHAITQENQRLRRVLASKDKTIAHLRSMLNDNRLCDELRVFEIE
jgi:regulator of replication initiation timing